MRTKITDRFLRDVKAGDRDLEIFDTGLRGFGVRVKRTQAGKLCTFFLRARVGSRNIRHSLGQYPALATDAARLRGAKEMNRIKASKQDAQALMAADANAKFELYNPSAAKRALN